MLDDFCPSSHVGDYAVDLQTVRRELNFNMNIL